MLDIQHIEERWHGEFIIPMSAPQTGRAKTILDKILSGCRLDPERGCWTWLGGTSGNGRGGGYGRVNVDGGTMAVHRVMFTLFHGPIPPRKQIDHKCRNRLCCNPDHLEMVTHKENQKRRDMERGLSR